MEDRASPEEGTGNHAERHPRLSYRGISYDSGTNFDTLEGTLSREVWSPQLMREEIHAIRHRLRCNSVTVLGSEWDRLTATVTAAVEQGLHVWFQPQIVNRPQEEVLDLVGTAARFADSLRRDGADIRVSVGAEHGVYTPGIVPGEGYLDRMWSLVERQVPAGEAAAKLNGFLTRAAQVARASFGGEIIYAAAPFEDVDWRPFDFVGLDYMYSYHPEPAGYVAELQPYLQHDRPLVICEFGTATYRGAAAKGAAVHEVLDLDGPEPVIAAGYQRDEQEQADYLRVLLDVFAAVGVVSATVSTFIYPALPHSSELRRDLDAASFAVARTIRERHEDSASPYRWEPKQAFDMLAAYNAGGLAA